MHNPSSFIEVVAQNLHCHCWRNPSCFWRFFVALLLASTPSLCLAFLPIHQYQQQQSCWKHSASRSFLCATRLTGLDQPTVWHEFSPLAVQHKAVNLGQGFPDWDPPAFVIQSMKQALESNTHQYARSAAHMPLAHVLAEWYSERWETPIDPAAQIVTSVGCTQALYCALQGLVNPGDNVLLLEPAFDIYDAQVKLAGGVPVHVPLIQQPLNTNDNNTTEIDANQVFSIDWDALEATVSTKKPKLLLLNTPHNPTGKVFTQAELQRISDTLPSDTIVIADEVYEHLVFDSHKHVSMATLRPHNTLTLSSSGKTFSATGWKVGWAVGPPHLVQAIAAVQQWVNFCTPTPNQDAIARSLRWAHDHGFEDPVTGQEYPSYYAYLANTYQRKRNLLVDALQNTGVLTPIVPPGTFFVMADTSKVDFPYENYRNMITPSMPTTPMPRDWAMARWFTEEVGVTAIPPCSFYDNPKLASNLLRFAFCKTDPTLLEARRRLDAYFG